MPPLCPRHPNHRAPRRCASCRRPICARCQFRNAWRLYCGPACAREGARSGSPALFGAAAILATILAGAAWLALERRSSIEPPRRRPAPAAPSAPLRLAEAERAVALPAATPRPEAARAVARRRSDDSPPDLFQARLDGAADRPIVVSFDAGASNRGAAEILDALRQRSIRTSVFLTGEFILRFPEIARRVGDDGHEVGNHTFSHPHLTQFASGGGQRLRPGVTEEFLRGQLARTAEIYEKTTGRRMAPIWRAPFGEENSEIRAWASRAGYTHVSWTHGNGASLDSLDWVSDESSPRYRSSRRVIDRLLATARPGGIILMHLGSERSSDPVGREVPRLLDGLAAEGYRFARATEFLPAASEAR